MTKNQEKILKVLDFGPRSYTELQERSGVPDGSFGRSIGELVTTGQVVNEDGKYRLARTPSHNHTQQAENDSRAIESNPATDSSAIAGDSSEPEVDERDIPETPRKPIFRVGKRKSTTADTLTVAITREDGTIENISHAEHQKRKGYPGVMP
jgi:hypothetical protein